MRWMVVFLILALGLAACTAKTMPGDVKDNTPNEAISIDDLPPEPAPPAGAAEPATKDAQEVVAATSVLAGTPVKKFEGKVGDIKCSVTDKKITFTLYNDGDDTWSLDQEVGFSPQPGLINAKVFVNDYEASRKSKYIEGGVTLFGPSDKFSENCGGVSRLEPGKTVDCTLYPVPLKPQDAYTNKNQVWVAVPPQSVKYVQFTCN